MRGSPGAPEEILRALEEENVVLRTECDIHQVELASASHLIQTLDDEALTLRKRIKELEPMEERAQKVVEENVKLKATLQRQKVTIRKMMGETYDSDEDDISVENLKEEMLQLQEKLAETSARKEELLAENERLLALAGGEQDDFPEGTSNAANAKTGSVSSTKAAERTAETLKKRVEELEASLRNSEETSKLLTETEEEIEQISNQISEVENKNLQLHKELQLRLETEENLREKLRRLGHDQHEHGDGADDAVEVLGIKEAGDSGNGKDLPGIDILKRTSSSSASRGRSRSKHRRSRSSSSGRGSSISSGIGRLTDDEHFICEAAPGADAAIEIVKVKENKMAPEVSARSRKMQIDTVHHVAISLAPRPDDDLLLKELRAVAEVASGEVEKEPGVARIEDLRRRYEVLQRTQGRLMQSHAVELAKLNRNNEHLRGLLLKTCRKYGVRKKDLADLCAPFNEGVQKIGVDVDAGTTSFAFCDRTVENASVLKTYLRGDACFLNDLNDAAEAVKMALVYADKYHKNVTPIPLTMHYLEKTSYVLNNYDRFPDSLLSLLQLLPFRIFGYVLVDMPLHATRLSLDLAKQAAESEARSDSMEYFLKKAAEKLKTIDTVDPTAHIITKKINRDDTFEIGSTRNPLRKARLWPNTRSKIDPGWLHSYDYTGMFF
eukprot:g5885.t1